MDAANESSEGSPFILLGLTTNPSQQQPLFVLFLVLYVAGILGNGLIVAAIRASPALHTPMYFLLAHLSFADLCFTSVTVPEMLANLLAHDHSISLAGCLTQMYFFFALGVTDSCLLAAMAYDRYVAIRHPLHYATRIVGDSMARVPRPLPPAYPAYGPPVLLCLPPSAPLLLRPPASLKALLL